MTSKISFRHNIPELSQALDLRPVRARYLKRESKAYPHMIVEREGVLPRYSHAIEFCETIANNRAEFSYALTFAVREIEKIASENEDIY